MHGDEMPLMATNLTPAAWLRMASAGVKKRKGSVSSAGMAGLLQRGNRAADRAMAARIG